ncbi:hypothetical protein [Clostridium botulinum]|nr:hypothetical protein [Clostridium botulinum]
MIYINLNTSYVKVQRTPVTIDGKEYTNLNTSYVNVQPYRYHKLYHHHNI